MRPFIRQNFEQLAEEAIENGRLAELMRENVREVFRGGFRLHNQDMEYEGGDVNGENTRKLLRGDSYQFMRQAVYGGRLTMMDWLLENDFGRNAFLVARHVVDIGRLDMIEWLIEHNLVEAGWALELAARSCRLDIARHLYDRYWSNIRAQPYYPLEESVSPHYLRGNENPPFWIHNDTLRTAVSCGSVEMVEWLIEIFSAVVDFSDFGRLLIDVAGGGGHLPMMQYLHQMTTGTNGEDAQVRGGIFHGAHPMCSTEAMDQAATYNHFEIVQWLHSNRTEGCTTKAMDGAASNGHLDVVQFLHEHRSEGCTTKAMDDASRNGHLDVIKWLHQNRAEGCTVVAMNGAARGGHLEVVKWLHENRGEGCTVKAMNGAASMGALNVVKWLHHNRLEGSTDAAMRGAAEHGHLDVVQWLYEHRTEGSTSAAMDMAAGGWGSAFDVVLYLHSQSQDGCTGDAFQYTRKMHLYVDIHEPDSDYPKDNTHDWLVQHYPAVPRE